jgi:hypothetical protein
MEDRDLLSIAFKAGSKKPSLSATDREATVPRQSIRCPQIFSATKAQQPMRRALLPARLLDR